MFPYVFVSAWARMRWGAINNFSLFVCGINYPTDVSKRMLSSHPATLTTVFIPVEGWEQPLGVLLFLTLLLMVTVAIVTNLPGNPVIEK